jgi:monoamine oxidase
VSEHLDAPVVVVGAGLAGLTAARRLAAAGTDAVVLEARDRVGGRTLNHTFDDGTTVEMGGQWIGPEQHRVHALLDELGLETFPTHDEGEHVWCVGSRHTRFRGDVPPLSKPALLDLAQAQARFDRLARRVPLDAPWRAPRAAEWDRETFASWVRRNTRTAGARFFFDLYAEAVFAAETHDFSLLHALAYTHAGRGMNSLVGTRGGAQQDRVVGGTPRLSERMAADLGDAVRLGAPVRRIEQDGTRVRVVADGVTVTAGHAVVAISPTLAGRVDYDPALPALRDQLTQKMPAGSVIKVNVVYDDPWWRAEGLSGQAIGDRDPVRVTFDNTPPAGAPGILLGFLEAGAARHHGARPLAERRAAVLRSLVAYFGPHAARPHEYLELDWSAEPWTRGCYGAHLAPGTWTQFGPALREPVGRLHWAGAETATEWNGYMDGAIASGERAAAEVLAVS